MSVIVIFLSLGIELPQTPFDTVRLNGPTLADTDGNAMIVVDSEAHRMLFLDANYELTRIVNFDEEKPPLQAITDVSVAKAHAYVAGVNYYGESNLIERESILQYGLYRSPYTTVLELGSERLYQPRIKSLNDSGEGLYVTLLNRTGIAGTSSVDETIKVILLAGGEEKTVYESKSLEFDVFSAGYDDQTDTVVTVSQRGVINDSLDPSEKNPFADYAFSEVDLGSNGCTYATDGNTGAVCKVDLEAQTVEPIITNMFFSSLSVNGDRIVATSLADDGVVVADLDGHIEVTLKRVRLSWYLALFVSAVWLSWATLLCVAVGYIVYRVRIALKTLSAGGIGHVFAVVAVIVAVAIGLSTNYYHSLETATETRRQEVNAFADLIVEDVGSVSEAMEELDDRDLFRAYGSDYSKAMENMNEVLSIPYSITVAAGQNGIGTYFTVYGKDEDGVYVLRDSMNDRTMGSSMTTPEMTKLVGGIFDGDDGIHSLREGSSARGSTFYRLIGIPTTDGKGCAGVIEFGSYERQLKSSIAGDLMENAVETLVLLVVVYIVYAEVSGSGHCMLTYVKLKDRDKKRDALALLTRPYTFIVSTLIACDSVMSTLIARSMVTNPTTAGLLIALPAAMQGVGLVLGQVAYGLVSSRWSVRRIVVAFSLLMMAAAGGAVHAVNNTNLALYISMKLVLGIAFGLLYTLGYSLPRQASKSNLKHEASGGVRRTDTSAAALGTVTGGYIAQILGNRYVYVLLLIGSVVLIVFALTLFLPMHHALEGKVERPSKQWREVVRLYTAKELIALIACIMVPAVLASGYGSFIFPLYCADRGLSSSAITRLCVLGQLVVYVLIDGIEYASGRYGKWRMAYFSVALIGVTFMLLHFNAIFTLAVVTIVLVGVFCKASDAWKGLWTHQANISRTPVSLATGLMYATRSAILIAQPLIMGMMVRWPADQPPLVLSVLALVGALVFALVTRGSAMSEA